MFGQLSNNKSLRETKIKVQHLVFPNGIFWNHENGCYRTPEKGLIFNIIDSFSGDYKKRKQIVLLPSLSAQSLQIIEPLLTTYIRFLNLWNGIKNGFDK